MPTAPGSPRAPAPGPVPTASDSQVRRSGYGYGYGYGYGTNAGGEVTYLTVYCGRCRASFTPDRDWVTRYFAAARKTEPLDVQAFLDDKEAKFVAYLSQLGSV